MVQNFLSTTLGIMLAFSLLLPVNRVGSNAVSPSSTEVSVSETCTWVKIDGVRVRVCTSDLQLVSWNS